MCARMVGGAGVLVLGLVVGCSQQAAPVADALAVASPTKVAGAAGPAEPARPKIYDASADGFEQIAKALKIAEAGDKHVLLQFGAEWCGWCHKLHRLFESDERIGQALETNYVVVLIDVDGDHNAAVNEKYGNPTQHGLPVIVVLDADGTQLTTQNTADLEEGDHHDPTKVMAFLEEWTPGSSDAEDVAATSDATEVAGN